MVFVAGKWGVARGANKKRNMLCSPPEMARRPERGSAETLDRKQLAELYRNLSMLSPSHVESFYREAYSRCSLGCGVPPAKAVQELVTAWRLLRKWRRRGR